MKIYSSKANNNQLDQFVGKDIWVKVDLDYMGDAYVRLTNKVEDEYWFNAWLSEDGSDDVDEILYDELTAFDDEIKLLKPIKTLNTEDIVEQVEHMYDNLG